MCEAPSTPLPSLDDSYLSDIALLFVEPPHWDEYLPDLSHLFAKYTCDALQVSHPSTGVSEEFIISVVGSAPFGILTTSTFPETFIDPPSAVDPFSVVEDVLFPSHHVDILSTGVHSSHSDSSTHMALPSVPWHSLARPMSHFHAPDSEFFVFLPSVSFVEWVDFQHIIYVLPKGRHTVHCRWLFFSPEVEDLIIKILLGDFLELQSSNPSMASFAFLSSPFSSLFFFFSRDCLFVHGYLFRLVYGRDPFLASFLDYRVCFSLVVDVFPTGFPSLLGTFFLYVGTSSGFVPGPISRF